MERLGFESELQRMLRGSGLSLRELARQVPVDAGHLSRVANGKRPPGLDLARRCDEILARGQHTLEEAARADARSAGEGKDAQADPFTVYMPQARNGRIELVALDRRSLLKGAAAGAAALVTGSFPRTESSRHLGPEIADHLVDLRATLVRSDSLLGPGRLVVTVAEQLASVQEMLLLAKGALRPRMFEIAALFAEFQGWLQDDVGSRVSGTAWTGRALEWAEVSGDDSVTAYMLMRRAQQAANAGDALLATGLSGAALRRSGASPWVRAAAAQQQAHGYALLEEDASAMESLDAAMELVAGCSDPHGPYELASWCTEDYVHAQRGAVLVRLRRYEQAVGAFDDALARWPVAYRRERGLHMARKAQAMASGLHQAHVDHASSGGLDIDDALTVGSEALSIGIETGSRRTIDELRVAAAELRAVDGSKEVSEFTDAVTYAAREGAAS